MRTAPRQILRLNVKNVSAALPGSSTPPGITSADAPNSQQAHAASKPAAPAIDTPSSPPGFDGRTTGGNYDAAPPVLLPGPRTIADAAAATAGKLEQ